MPPEHALLRQTTRARVAVALAPGFVDMMASFDHVFFRGGEREREAKQWRQARDRRTGTERFALAVWEGPWWDPDFCRGDVGNQQEHKQQVPHITSW